MIHHNGLYSTTTRTERNVVAIMLLTLAGYLAFDRAFAYLHVPGLPLFVGEIVLFVVVFGLVRVGDVARAWRRSAAAQLAIVFIAYGLARAIPGLIDQPITAAMDSAIWYYALIGIVVAGALERHSSLAEWASTRYERAMPLLLAWLVISTPLAELDSPFVPDSTISIFAHRAGNSAVHAVMIFAWVWSEAGGGMTSRRRWVLSLGALVALFAAGTQSRGGLVAASVGLLLTVALVPSGGRVARQLAGAVLALGVVLVAINPTLELGARDVSLSQFVTNVTSIAGDAEGSNLNANRGWRLQHWSAVAEGVADSEPWVGHGFGTNIAELYGIPQAAIGLRNPHNSHLNVYARMGSIGLLLWLILWAVWFSTVLAATRRVPVADSRVRGLSTWAVVGTSAILVNAIFDPTLEGPQVAYWLWTLFGVGVYASSSALRLQPEITIGSGPPS